MVKLKVVWICHFINEEVNNIVSPGAVLNEMAPWISQLAKLFESVKEVEIHIVAPYLKGPVYTEFTLRNIHYHLFNTTLIFGKWNLLELLNFNIRTRYLVNRLFVAFIVRKIQPDIIHLHGAENAYYSSSIMQFKNKFPVLVTVQGFISHTTINPLSIDLIFRINIEKKILSSFRHICYRTAAMGKEILRLNPNAILHWHNYPIIEVLPYGKEDKFDIVYFARVCKDKGFDDLLLALSIIKSDFPSIKLCVIGTGFENYIQIADQLLLSDNIHWAGFLRRQDDVFKLASCAKISVLPTYHDTIPGTIIESMFLKIPVVAYAVGGIPEINETEHCISLVDRGDVKNLAKEIIYLLSDPAKMQLQSELAYSRAKQMFDNSIIPEQLLPIYKEVISNFYRG